MKTFNVDSVSVHISGVQRLVGALTELQIDWYGAQQFKNIADNRTAEFR